MHPPTRREVLQRTSVPQWLWHHAPLERGIDGRGRTVVILGWLACAASPRSSPTTNILHDVSSFDSYFHLPPVTLTVVPETTPKASADVAIGEEVEDVEMIHAVAPGAAIRVVLTGPSPTERARP